MPGCAIESATSSSATMPANALRMPTISRMAGIVMTLNETSCAEPARKRGGEAAHAARRVQRQQHQEAPEDDEPQLVGDPQPFGQRDEYDRADQWPEQIARAAEDHDHDQVDALQQIEG